MDRLLIWGIGQFYDNFIAQYVINEKINVIGFVTGLETVCNFLDGIRIYKPDEIKEIEFDYIVIANQNNFNEIKRKIMFECQISEEKCVNGKVFKHPCFNWERYKRIRNEKPSIIAEACYGGYIYHQLGLQFYSPFINTRIFERDYLRMIGNLDHYLRQDIHIIRNMQYAKDMQAHIDQTGISWGKMGYPIVGLGDIELHAIHTSDINDYIEEWNRRVQRINRENIWVLMIIENDEMAEKFSRIPVKNKVGFFYKKTDCKNIVSLNDWGNFSSRLNYIHDFISYVHHLFYDEHTLRSIDIFKLFCGEQDFIRIS